jgi:hypothetical protein
VQEGGEGQEGQEGPEGQEGIVEESGIMMQIRNQKSKIYALEAWT